ncbi:MAG: hypothetical protein JSW40_03070 [Candidatus Omnitrophota bacterium]|nr:MAG: hypothetical protein JSW40_03070 [Candidatus Omnitrophota bacterium]
MKINKKEHYSASKKAQRLQIKLWLQIAAHVVILCILCQGNFSVVYADKDNGPSPRAVPVSGGGSFMSSGDQQKHHVTNFHAPFRVNDTTTGAYWAQVEIRSGRQWVVPVAAPGGGTLPGSGQSPITQTRSSPQMPRSIIDQTTPRPRTTSPISDSATPAPVGARSQSLNNFLTQQRQAELTRQRTTRTDTPTVASIGVAQRFQQGQLTATVSGQRAFLQQQRLSQQAQMRPGIAQRTTPTSPQLPNNQGLPASRPLYRESVRRDIAGTSRGMAERIPGANNRPLNLTRRPAAATVTPFDNLAGQRNQANLAGSPVPGALAPRLGSPLFDVNGAASTRPTFRNLSQLSIPTSFASSFTNPLARNNFSIKINPALTHLTRLSTNMSRLNPNINTAFSRAINPAFKKLAQNSLQTLGLPSIKPNTNPSFSKLTNTHAIPKLAMLSKLSSMPRLEIKPANLRPFISKIPKPIGSAFEKLTAKNIALSMSPAFKKLTQRPLKPVGISNIRPNLSKFNINTPVIPKLSMLSRLSKLEAKPISMHPLISKVPKPITPAFERLTARNLSLALSPAFKKLAQQSITTSMVRPRPDIILPKTFNSTLTRLAQYSTISSKLNSHLEGFTSGTISSRFAKLAHLSNNTEALTPAFRGLSQIKLSTEAPFAHVHYLRRDIPAGINVAFQDLSRVALHPKALYSFATTERTQEIFFLKFIQGNRMHREQAMRTLHSLGAERSYLKKLYTLHQWRQKYDAYAHAKQALAKPQMHKGVRMNTLIRKLEYTKRELDSKTREITASKLLKNNIIKRFMTQENQRTHRVILNEKSPPVRTHLNQPTNIDLPSVAIQPSLNRDVHFFFTSQDKKLLLKARAAEGIDQKFIHVLDIEPSGGKREISMHFSEEKASLKDATLKRDPLSRSDHPAGGIQGGQF